MNGLNWALVPDDPGRDNVVIVTGFFPSWWTQEYGIIFGEDFHLDPEVHKSTLVKMSSLLNERFADVPNFFFSPFDYENSYPTERRYGDAFIPAIFGHEVSFDTASGHPYSEVMNLSDEQAGALTVPDVGDNPVLRSVLDQRPDESVAVAGELGYEGVINIGYRLRGEPMYMDLMDDDDVIDHIFEVVYQTIDTTAHTVRQWQDPAHTKPTHFINSNCLVNMMSPKMYADRLLKFDQRFNESFDIFGIHTCNWTVDPYLDAIAEIEGLGYLDMGPESDLDKIHRLFPELAPTVFYPLERIRDLSTSELCKDITELGKRIGRGYILFCDLETETSDDKIKAAHEAAAPL
jgi:hypothetical protein